MTDQEFEQRLRAWYHADGPHAEVASGALRQRVLAIPTALRRESPTNDRTRLLLLAAALLMGGAVAAGTGIVHLPQRELSPTPLPSEAAQVSPPPSGPPSTQEPPQQPQVPPTGPLARDVLAATQGFRLFPGGAGWAATGTAIYRTLDAGETWTDERPAGWTASAASALVDADTAYLASDSMPMVMAVTHSSGASWETATIDDSRIGGEPTFLFQSPMRGYATFPEKDSDTKLRVYATSDGGRTWSGPKSGQIPQIHWSLGKYESSGGALYLIPGKADNQPFDNRFVLSLDGGVTWKTGTFPIGTASPKAAQKWISRIWSDADGSIRMAIRAGDRHSIWSSQDDGRTWRLDTVLPNDIEVDENDFVSASEWIFPLDSGSGFRFTTDAGAHWHTRTMIDAIRIDPSTLDFASVDVGWALEECYHYGEFGRSSDTGDCQSDRAVLVSTKDGGRTWRPVGQATPATPTPSPEPGAAAWVAAGRAVTNAQAARGPGVAALTLGDGRVLAIGGAHADGSAALYDPTTGRWTPTTPMAHDRMDAAAVLLSDGRVFVVGGSYDNVDHGTTELFDPATGRWSRGPSMVRRKMFPKAVVLRDGRVLVVGTSPNGGVGEVSAEVFEPATGRWTPTGAPTKARFASSALIVLPDGRVLMAGGDDLQNRRLASTELYDPATGTWSMTGSMLEARDSPMATLLDDGRVLVVGGAHSLAGRSLPTGEVFDPAAGRWTAVAAMSVAHDMGSLTRLADGRVLVVGGDGSGGFDPIATTEIYDPANDTWSLTAPVREARYGHAAAALADGSVLVVGGHSVGGFHYLGSAERFYPNGSPAS